MPIIKFTNITHSYQSKEVIKKLSLAIAENEVSCLLGGSGSGKTTLLRLIAGLETPESGQIYMGNTLVTNNHKIIVPPNKRNVGFIFQDLALWPHFTVYKNIAFGLTERKEKKVKATVFKMLHFFNLASYAEKYPHQLSGGQQQLVAIARALVLKPNILLMDEPLANLDVLLKQKIMAHLKNLKQQFGLSLLYVTHDHKEAFALADNIIVLNKGAIEEIGTVNQLKKSTNKFVSNFLEY